jgi:3',5'-nucleoside bisphosphate phosphatase
VRIDLHTHSYVSDGTQAPGDVVASAAQAGLDVVALTDHDTTAGWEEAAAAAIRHGIGLVRGIEISCARDGISVHLLGYLHDPADAALLAELERSRSSRHTRAERIVRKLSADVPITYEEVLETAAPGATLGRPHIADALVAKGVVATRDDAFADYLYNGSPYHASHYAPDPVTAVRLVNAAGGVAVMAHPFAGRRGRLVDDEVIEAMAAAGLAGLEAHHRDHTPADVAHAEEMARRLGLFVTGSSDYHGDGKVNVLGENTTAPAVLRQMEERASGVPVLWP